MPRLEARRRREALEMTGRRVSVEELHALILAETEDEQKADEAAAAYAAEILRQEQTP